MEQDLLISVLFVVGITVESMTGALAAGRYKMDLMGVIFIALVTAIGGGSVRDILFNHHPLVWIKHPQYILIIVLAALLATRIPKFITKFERVFLLLDAIGLVAFSVIGTAVVMEKYQSMTLAICGGVITGVFGGILRDIFCNQIPLILRREIYASVALFASAFYYILLEFFGLSAEIASGVTLICGSALRIFAIYYKLGLPVFHFEDHNEKK
ncbi:trimeric intracellular cation channel family protein [Helicobacter mustelae]|uniref:Putative integral membrane protein n=1 Tax=Helicobacter mustelae (strain ATCC 43772 / CCUG 25715 / CIP 103759 / LMG 18044 / NCTC 12198 / R85-136P) TaxID=679897 RepID=D3UG52_HELM1|nr:trimeric intracellular cation channel family protein [Helicobacter mustelae]CBG39473.1 putative integral membrane protein [Helicobacter mustelae 12198]SQH70986.1 Predicted membrane protein [Helicobacter mustelae]STP12114.1 Predicted membrane protein [Helicobacter mustelae]